MTPFESDVLIIGGGLAGCMAAIRAREEDVSVTLVEKSNTVCSGQAGSGIDHMWAYVPELHGRLGWTIEDLVDDHIEGIGHGFGNRELLHFIARESYPRLLDLERFGLNIRYPDSTIPGKFRLVLQFHSVPTALNVDARPIKAILTREARRRGVTIINRVTMTDLLVTDGAIAGAVGVGTRDGRVYIFKAKTVVLSSGGKTGRLGREPTGIDFNLHLPGNLCADGKAMALAAGLPIMNMEFLSPRRLGIANYDFSGGPPRNTWQPAAAVVDGRGKTIVPRTTFYEWGDLEKGYRLDAAESRRLWLAQREESAMPSVRAWQERGPFYLDCTKGTEEEIGYIEWAISNEGKGAQFLRHLHEEGIDLRTDKIELGLHGREIGNLSCAGLVVNGDMETGLKNLFAAGDEVGGTPFTASTGAFVTGWRCGQAAAQRAKNQVGFLQIDNGKAEKTRELCMNLLGNGSGYLWQETGYALQNLMDDYCGEVRSGEMLLRGLDRLKSIRAMPLRAKNAHELGRCLEVRTLLDAGEMVIRASLAREESRRHPVNFYRADFPEQDDRNWRAYSIIRKESDRFLLSKVALENTSM
jgi:succinate dehydrogenase/fumarate reductase flavoprotein subunit